MKQITKTQIETQFKTQIKTQIQTPIIYPKCIGKFGNGLRRNCFRCIFADTCIEISKQGA